MSLACLRREKANRRTDRLLSEYLLDFLELYSNTKTDLTRFRVNLSKRDCLEPRRDSGFFSLASPQD